jgi:hypothetical protein
MYNVVKALEEISNELYEISIDMDKKNEDFTQDDRKKIFDQHRKLAVSFGVLETVLNKIHNSVE